jgi:tetratricopeptide (TPR) repeat protein
VFFQVFALDRELEERGVLEFRFLSGDKVVKTIQRDVNSYESSQNFLEEFSLQDFSPGKYRIEVILLDEEGKEYLQESEEFSITQKALPDPWIVSQTDAGAGDPVYSFILGNQFLNKGDIGKARDKLEDACSREPETKDYALSYARVLLILEEFQKAKDVLMPFSKTEARNFGVFYYLGKAAQKLKQHREAIPYYQEALSHKGDVVDVLNSIGECYFKLGEWEEALQAWEKSLEINPGQENIKKSVETLKKEQ